MVDCIDGVLVVPVQFLSLLVLLEMELELKNVEHVERDFSVVLKHFLLSLKAKTSQDLIHHQ